MGRVSRIPEIEARIGQPLDKYLKDAAKQGKQPPEIAVELGISLSTIYEFIKKFGLKDTFKEAAQAEIYARKSGELKDEIDSFLKEKERIDRSPKTLLNYKDALYKFLWWLDVVDKRPATLGTFENKQVINDWLYYIKSTPVRWGGKSNTGRKEVGPVTINMYRRILGTFGGWLKFNDKIKDNPVDKVSKSKVPKRDPEDVTDEAIQKIFDSFSGTFAGVRNATITLMFLDTGMRIGGLCSLKVDTLDLDTGFGKVIEKGNKQRTVHLSKGMIRQLRAYLAMREPIARTNKLWVTETGDEFKIAIIQLMYRELSKKLGIKTNLNRSVHPHVFRHVWAKKIFEAHIDPYVIMAMGGWEDLELVMHYARAYNPMGAWEEHDRVTPITQFLPGVSHG